MISESWRAVKFLHFPWLNPRIGPVLEFFPSKKHVNAIGRIIAILWCHAHWIALVGLCVGWSSCKHCLRGCNDWRESNYYQETPKLYHCQFATSLTKCSFFLESVYWGFSILQFIHVQTQALMFWCCGCLSNLIGVQVSLLCVILMQLNSCSTDARQWHTMEKLTVC